MTSTPLLPDAYYGMHQDIKYETLYPALLSKIETIEPRRLIDIGCGNGDFTAAAAMNCEFTLGVDVSGLAISSSIESHGAESPQYQVVDWGEELPSQLKTQFDLATMVLVLVTVENTEKAERMLLKTFEILSDGGTLLVADSHPCFRDRDFSTFSMNLDMNEYGKDMPGFDVSVYPNPDRNPDERVTFRDFHRSLKSLFRLLTKVGFQISNIDEINDSNSTGCPPFICFECKKPLPLL